MDYTNKAKRSQRELFTELINILATFNQNITSYLAYDLHNLLSQNQLVLDNAFIRTV